MKAEEQEFLDALPSIYDRHDAVPDDLTGAVVMRFGTITGQRVEGGGLVIDYLPRGLKRTKRIVFGFNGCGMWVKSMEFLTD